MVLVLIVAVGLLVTAIFGHRGGSTTVTPKGNFSVSQARDYRGFPVFYPGESIDGDELTAVARDPLGPMRQNQESVLFMYGTCEIPAGAEGGCSLPVSVSNEPACSRNLAMYSGSLEPEAGRDPSPGNDRCFLRRW